MAAELGTPLMPWQQQVADVAYEVDPESGLLWYREVVLVVPRQSGKTTLVLAAAVHRCNAWPARQNVTYTAQTRNDARAKWEHDHVEALDASPIGRRRPKPYRVRRANGSEAIVWRNRSRHGISAGTEKSGHGSTLDLAFIDEAFAQPDSRLEQAFKPAQITRPDPQTWVLSTAGKSAAASPYLWAKVTAGRERVTEGGEGRVAYFEWSAPDDADRSDPETWWATMPALGHTVTEAAVQADFESMDPSEFDRAYLNRWTPAKSDRVIPEAAWSSSARSVGIDGAPAFGLDVSADGEWAAICAVGAAEDGVAGEVVKADRGTGWLVQACVELASHGGPGVAVDSTGPAAGLIGDLERAGVAVHPVNGPGMAQACGRLRADVVDGRFAHRSQPVLDVAVGSAARRVSGDTWRWSRSGSPVDISPLVALTVAYWLHETHVPEPVAEPTAAPDFIVV